MKAVYKASDGSEHASTEAAERRDALRQASRELEVAARKVVRCLGESAMTADGHWFDMSRSRDYWVIGKSWVGLPKLFAINLWPHQLSVDFDRTDASLTVREYQLGDRGEGRYVEYKINELYLDHGKAKAALAVAAKKRLAELTDEMKEIESQA